MLTTAGVRWVVTLCRVQPFLVVAAVGSTLVPHPRRKCFLSEAGCPPKGTKMKTVRVVEEWVARTQTFWPGRMWWDCKPRTFQNHHYICYIYSISGVEGCRSKSRYPYNP